MIMPRTYAAIVAALLPVLVLAQDTTVLNGRLQSPLWGDGWAVTGVFVYASNVYAGAAGTTNAITRNGLVDISALLGGGAGDGGATQLVAGAADAYDAGTRTLTRATNVQWSAVQGAPAFPPTVDSARWITSTVTIPYDQQYGVAVVAMPTPFVRRARAVLATTNNVEDLGGATPFRITFHAGGSNVASRLSAPYTAALREQEPEVDLYLASAPSPSNSAAGATVVYPSTLPVVRGDLLEISSGAGTEYVNALATTSWVVTAWSTNGGYDGAQELIWPMHVFRGQFFHGQGYDATGDGDIYVRSTGGVWSVSHNSTTWGRVVSMCAWRGRLYAGGGYSAGMGDVISTADMTTWTTNRDGAQEAVLAMAVFRDAFFVGEGTGAGDGDIYRTTNGTDFVRVLDTANGTVDSLLSWRGRLWAASGGSVYCTHDGTAWVPVWASGVAYTRALMDAGQYILVSTGDGGGNGDIWASANGVVWSKVYDTASYNVAGSLVGYAGNYWAATGYSGGQADVRTSANLVDWPLSYDGSAAQTYELCVFEGALYASLGYGAGQADILRYAAGQAVTIEPALTLTHTNPTISVVAQWPVGNLATQTVIRVESDRLGYASNTVVRVELEVLE